MNEDEMEAKIANDRNAAQCKEVWCREKALGLLEAVSQSIEGTHFHIPPELSIRVSEMVIKHCENAISDAVAIFNQGPRS